MENVLLLKWFRSSRRERNLTNTKAWLFGSGFAVLFFLAYLGVEIPALVILGIVLLGILLAPLLKEKNWPQSWIGSQSHSQDQSLDIPKTRFEDIGGQSHAKKELQEALDFLIEPKQTEYYGIRQLKGILLSGPPGTGKTLLAKAAAHYTHSVFIHASGSEFVERYVGVGAKRVRELFERTKKAAKKARVSSAILFIDEIDVIGGKRDGSQQREYDQTLNQLLTEMDGITTNVEVQILVMAATNRKDLLDDALLRPGRFDRLITVDLPDRSARLKILELHTHEKPLADDVGLEKIAEETFGFSGAQLESLSNEAAIYALREKKKEVTQKHLMLAIDKVMMGEKIDRETSEEEKERVAIHELGHAIMAEVVNPGSVAHVALSPRGQALGYVRHHPGEDRHLYTQEHLEHQILIGLAGAVAESIILGHKSTGARSDYEQCNRYAKAIVESGFTDLGIIDINLLPKEQLQIKISQILQELEQKCTSLLLHYRSLFPQFLRILLQEETLSGDEFRGLLSQKEKKLVQ